MKTSTMKINSVEWTEDTRRALRSCEGCKELTRGRIEKVPWCLACATRQMLKPLRAVGELFRNLMRSGDADQ